MTRLQSPMPSARPIPANVHYYNKTSSTIAELQNDIISSPESIKESSRSQRNLCQTYYQCWSQYLNVEFLKHHTGFLKLWEAFLGTICQYLLLGYGSPYSEKIGGSYTEFLISVSSVLVTTILLIVCYIGSKETYQLIRTSVFETAFNTLAALLYLSSCSYLAYGVSLNLYPDYTRIPYFQVYPALCAAYTLGFLAGIVHGVDAILAYKFMQSRLI